MTPFIMGIIKKSDSKCQIFGRKGTYSVLVWVKINIATVEISLEIPQKL